jgi:hypothetical protein
VNAEFNVWLLIVGLVVGAGLVWLVIMDSRRRDSEVDAAERLREAAWLSAVLAEDGIDVSPDAAYRLLVLHRAYLDAPPPDEMVEAPVVADQPVVVADQPIVTDRPAVRGVPGSELAEQDRVGVDRGA